ncbi:Helix-turn-helix domain protein [compost metagenome]
MTQILTAEQLAEALSLSGETIRRLTRSGELPHHVIGGSVRYALADVLAKTAVNKHPDDEAVDRFATAMHEKMAAARAKGKEGWDDPARCSAGHLQELMRNAAGDLEYVDVANYAMMLWARGEK